MEPNWSETHVCYLHRVCPRKSNNRQATFAKRRGYDLTPELKSFLENEVGIDVGSWQTRGMQPAEWPDFGSVQKTGSEFRAAYDAFASQCVSIAKEVS